MKTIFLALTFFIAAQFSATESSAKNPPPPSLEDEGNSFINNGGDDSGDTVPDQVSEEAFGDQTDYDKHAPTTTQAPKAKISAKPVTKSAPKKGSGCEIRIVLKCGGDLIKNRPGALLFEGVSYSKNTNASGELIESLPCGNKPAGKKFFLRFSEFNTEITFDKVPYSIDIPKGQCL